jgi:hypothetical protein
MLSELDATYSESGALFVWMNTVLGPSQVHGLIALPVLLTVSKIPMTEAKVLAGLCSQRCYFKTTRGQQLFVKP